MRSRAVREGSVGLLIITGIGLFVLLGVWVRGFQFGKQSYQLEVELPNTLGLSEGSSVRYRGVDVGRVTDIKPSANGVTVQAEIESATLLIPRNTVAEASQSGFIGQVTLDLRPLENLAAGVDTAELSPIGSQCDASIILCDGDRLQGEVGISFDDLIRATARLANLLEDGDLLNNANSALKNVSTAAVSVNQLSKNANTTLRGVNVAARDLSQLSRDARGELNSIGTAASAVTQAAGQVGTLGTKFDDTANRIGVAADQVTALVQVNRGTLTSALTNLDQAGQELKVAVQALTPILGRVESGELLTNLETLAANGAAASANLRDLSATLNNPITLIGLAQTLDAARVTFQNTQKITTDLDQLTGDPTVRENLIRLINGLSKLVSSSQELQQQLQALNPADPAQPAKTSNQ